MDVKELVQEGLRFFDQQNWQSAIASFDKAEGADPNHPTPYFLSSLGCFAESKIEESKRRLEQGLQLRPASTLGQNIAALHAFHEKNIDKALGLLKQFGLVEHPRIQAFLLLGIEKNLLELEA